MPEVVMVIAPEVFRDEEYAEPKRVLESRGAKVVTASVAPGECIGKLGLRAQAEISVDDAAGRDWDAVFFVGGAGAAVYFDDAAAHALATTSRQWHRSALGDLHRAFDPRARRTACRVFALRRFHRRKPISPHTERFGPVRPSTVDGRIVTGNGPEAAIEFGQTIGNLLGLPRD